MVYRIEGLAREVFRGLLGLGDDALAERGALRVVADSKPGFPCRVTLEDAAPGERLILFHHVSHDVPTPFRSAYAIYVRESAGAPACFDSEGMLRGALLALPGEADGKIRDLFERPEIATIHAHDAAAGCFAAKIVRD